MARINTHPFAADAAMSKGSLNVAPYIHNKVFLECKSVKCTIRYTHIEISDTIIIYNRFRNECKKKCPDFGIPFEYLLILVYLHSLMHGTWMEFIVMFGNIACIPIGREPLYVAAKRWSDATKSIKKWLSTHLQNYARFEAGAMVSNIRDCINNGGILLYSTQQSKMIPKGREFAQKKYREKVTAVNDYRKAAKKKMNMEDIINYQSNDLRNEHLRKIKNQFLIHGTIMADLKKKGIKIYCKLPRHLSIKVCICFVFNVFVLFVCFVCSIFYILLQCITKTKQTYLLGTRT